MLSGQSYITPMMSRDVIGEIRGDGVCHTGGSVMESDQFETLAQYFTFQLKHKLYIFLPIFQSNRIHKKA